MLQTSKYKQNTQITQKYTVTLNKTADQDIDTYQPTKTIQYMKSFYQQTYSIDKLKKLIDYYLLSVHKHRFLHPKAKKLQENNIQTHDNGKSPALSTSTVQFKFIRKPILPSSICKSRNSISYIKQIVNSLQKKEQKKRKKTPQCKLGLTDKKLSKTLNYIPYRSQKNSTKAVQAKFKGQLQNIEQKWIKTSKILNKSRQ